ncbi:uncharacterized protein HPMKM1_0206, partial [Helicobacter pylori]
MTEIELKLIKIDTS